MLQVLPFSGMAQAQGNLLQQQLGLIRQQQSLQPIVLQPVQQSSGSSVVIPTPTPAPDPETTYTFTQVAPAAVWTINHNLAAFPSVSLTDPLGNLILAQVQYVNSNQVVVTFSQPVAGSAYLNV